MPVLTLTTDLGTRDYYVGAVKGGLLESCAEATLVDISHHVEPYNIVEAAYILRHAYPEFPQNTIHIISVNTLDSKDTRHVIIHYDHQYFIGPDNGIFSLLFDDYPKEIYELSHNLSASSFPAKDLYVAIAGNLCNGQPPESMGKAVNTIQERTMLQPVVQESFIRGTVIFVDGYENVISNISKTLFDQVRDGRNFALLFKRYDTLQELSEHYYDVPVGEMLCLFNSASNLEIAINKGKASSLLGLQIGDTVQIDFT